MSFIKELEMMAFGSRMKNFTDVLMRDVAKIYKDLDVDFEPRWFTFFMLLWERDEEIPVTRIAEELNQSHPAVVQVANILEEKGLIIASTDESDHRKRLVSLSESGKKLAESMRITWEEIKGATEDYIYEVQPDFLEIIGKLEESYEKKGLYYRIRDRLKKRMREEIEIVGYEKNNADAFRTLNLEWLVEYLGITDYDHKVLSDPDKNILGKGGKIRLMKYMDNVIGCYALMPLGKDDCELCKFTISKKFRGLGLGSLLINDALKTATKDGFKKTYLFSHEKLNKATELYRNKGFKIVKDHPEMHDPTGRCSFVMSFNNH